MIRWQGGDSVVFRDYHAKELWHVCSLITDPIPDWKEMVEKLADDIVSIVINGELAGVAALVGCEVVASFDRTKMRGHLSALVEGCTVVLDSWGQDLEASCPIGDRHSAKWLQAIGFGYIGSDSSDQLFKR